MDFSAKYKFDLAFPFALKAGAAAREQKRDIRRYDHSTNYLGVNGDRNAGFTLDTDYSGEDPHWGLPPIEWNDPYVTWDHFNADPDLYAQTANQQRDEERYRRQNSQYLEEQIDSYYLQFETKLIDSRLNIVGGVRVEKTKDFGRGLLTTGPAETLEELLANSVERGYEANRSYDDSYPSIHFTYNLTEDLLLRASYSKTLGRPNFSIILPLTRVNDSTIEIDDGLGDIDPVHGREL
ncbi:MAG: TonB-dependent receptor domain-containing protein [Opitutaceae bacterium]